MKLKSFFTQIFPFLVVVFLFFLLAPINQSHAAALTWDGGGVDNNWSTCANWTTDACPASGDTLTFNGTSTKNSTVDASFTGTITSLTIASGYTGTITLARSLTTSSNFSQAAGTFNGDGQTMDINGTYSLTAGVFTAPSVTMSVASTFTISGSPTFNANGGTVTFNGTTAAVISCNNVTFNLVTFAHAANVSKTVSSNCSLPLGNNPTAGGNNQADIALNGTLSGTGTLTIGTPNVTNNNSLTLNNGSTLSGFSGLATGALTINSVTYNFGSYTTFTVTNAYTQTGGTVTIPSGADFNGAFVLNSPAVFNAPSGTASFASSFTLNSGTTFNANGGTVTFDGTTAATLSCNNATFNLVTFTHTTAITKTVSSDCSLPLGNNPTIGGDSVADFALNGVLSGTGTLTIGSQLNTNTFQLNSGSSISGFSGLAAGQLSISNVTYNFGSYTIFTVGGSYTQTNSTVTAPDNADYNSNFTLSSSSILNAPSGTVYFGRDFTLSSGTTFNANGGTVIFDGSINVSTLSCNNTVFNLVVIANTSGVKTIGSNCSLPLGNNPTAGAGGTIVLNGTLSGTGTLTTTEFFQLNPSYTLSGFTGLVTSYLYIGTDSNFSSYNILDINSGLYVFNNSTFTAPSGTMTIGGDSSFLLIDPGSTFSPNSGTLVLDGTSSQTIVGSITFYNLTRVTPGTLAFSAGTTQTILGTLTLQGNDSGKLLLRSSVPGTQWNFDPQGPRSLHSLDVQDSNNINGTILATCNSTDSGNNINWAFNPASCGSSGSGSSTSQSATCGLPTPGTTPINLYSALPTSGTSILLTFSSAADPYTHYALEYGTASGDYAYGAVDIGPKGTRQYLVQSLSPNTTYFFRVRAGNGCATGVWSNEISARTLQSGATSNLISSSTLTSVGYETGTDGEDGEGTGSNVSCTSYTVKSGDSLWEIARDELGSGSKFQTIIEQNKDEYPSLTTSNSLTVGWKLKINCDSKDQEEEKDPNASSQTNSNGEKTYDVSVIVKDEEDNPVGGANVTLHSTPRHATTNEKGIATFDKVEKGEHKVVIAYEDQVGEQKMVLAESDGVKRYELTVRVQKRNPLFHPVTLGVIAVMGGVIGILWHKLSRRNKRSSQPAAF